MDPKFTRREISKLFADSLSVLLKTTLVDVALEVNRSNSLMMCSPVVKIRTKYAFLLSIWARSSSFVV